MAYKAFLIERDEKLILRYLSPDGYKEVECGKSPTWTDLLSKLEDFLCQMATQKDQE